MSCSPKEFAEWRLSVCLSQRGLGIILGIHEMTVSKMERGILKIEDHPRMLLLDLLIRARRAKEVLKLEGTEFPSLDEQIETFKKASSINDKNHSR